MVLKFQEWGRIRGKITLLQRVMVERLRNLVFHYFFIAYVIVIK